MFRLTENQSADLLSQPESGMGYQHVEIVTDQSERVRAIAYNAEVVVVEDAPDMRYLQQDYARLRKELSSRPFNVREVKVIADYASRPMILHEDAGPRDYSGPAQEAAVGKTDGVQTFKRFHAYAN